MSSIFGEDDYQDNVSLDFGVEYKARDQYQTQELDSILQELGFGTGNIDTNVRTRDPIDRFSVFIYGICKDLDIGNSGLRAILKKAASTRNIQYKNPTAFVYGYLVTNNGKDKNYTLQTINEILNRDKVRATQSGIYPQDVIRYARLWLDIKV